MLQQLPSICQTFAYGAWDLFLNIPKELASFYQQNWMNDTRETHTKACFKIDDSVFDKADNII